MQNCDEALVEAIAELDQSTFEHCKRVQTLALTLGERMGLTPSELSHLGLGALLHDIGKRSIPVEILGKREPLTPEEWEIIQMHPQFGYELATSIGLSNEVKQIILCHHLWANGQGDYPQGLGGLKPCILTQITTVADVVDAMTSHRPYRPALSMSSCIEYLEENIGRQFNGEVVAVFKAELYRTSSVSIKSAVL